MTARRTLLAAAAAGLSAALTGDAPMAEADLTSLFAPPPAGPGQPATFRQGVVTAWNPLTAENTVQVGGTELTDLPILNTSEALLLDIGDVVSVVVATPGDGGASTFAILGRLTIPGTPQAATAINALADAIGAATVDDLESTSDTSYVDLSTVGPQVSVLIRASGRCLVLYGAYFHVQGIAFGHMSFSGAGPSGATVATSDYSAALGAGTGMSGLGMESGSTHARLLTGLTSGSWTFTAKYRSGGGFGNPANFSGRFMIAIPL